MNQTAARGTPDARVLVESIEHEVRRMPGNFATDCVVIGVAAAAVWRSLDLVSLIAWSGLAVLFALVRTWMRRHYLRQDETERGRWIHVWRHFSPVANIGWGVVWALFFFGSFARIELGLQFLLTMIIMGMSMMGALHGGMGARWQLRLFMGSASLCWLIWGQPYSIPMALLGICFIFVLEKVNAEQSAVVREKAELVGQMEALVADLDTRNAQLTEVSQAKTQLLATASHDVRQPIHAVLMALDDWTPDMSPAEHAERILVVRTRIAAMNDMLQGLLDMSRLDLGVFKLTIERADLRAFLHVQAAGHAELMRRKGLDFVIDTQAVDGMLVNTDVGLLGRMLSNLLTNAAKYTWQGSVRLTASRTADGGIAIAVADTGIGIPSADRHHVFKEYVRLSERHESTDGVGIGLAVVSKGAALLGYEVDLTSASGQGSTFTLTLPASSLARALPPSTAQSAPLPTARILLIEDDTDAATWTVRVLERAGHEVRTATHLAEALGATGPHFRPQVVVSDFQLGSSQNGIEAIAALRDHLRAPSLPSLLLTGDLTPQVRELARGVDVNVLHKPLRPGLLLDAIRSLVLTVPASADGQPQD